MTKKYLMKIIKKTRVMKKKNKLSNYYKFYVSTTD